MSIGETVGSRDWNRAGIPAPLEVSHLLSAHLHTIDQVEMIFAAIGIVAFIGAAGFFAWERHQMCLAEIEGSLRKYHATDIEIEFDWMDYDRDTFTYDVQYRDRSGNFHRNRCKVTSGRAIGDEAVYWVDPIGPPRA